MPLPAWSVTFADKVPVDLSVKPADLVKTKSFTLEREQSLTAKHLFG